ncbi:MAG: aminoglycoside phosphotransferase family protein [Defluviitaleaceae bacterium]|nr:aminoglycoside phosphotransferase family protein [Defluviitaleaceae bacterium]
MINKIKEILHSSNILPTVSKLTPLGESASGAYVFSADDKYVIKYTNMLELDGQEKSLKKEYDFYKLCDNRFEIIPEVIFQYSSETELLIIFKKYQPIKDNEWTEKLQSQAMEMCAQIHAMNATDFTELFASNNANQWDENTHNLAKSLESWSKLQNKFPESIDIALLKEMYQNFDGAISCADKIFIPKTLCHGDYHPWHFLKNGDKAVICDWQNADIGNGIGDVTFFISRGETRFNIDRDKLISAYIQHLSKYANIELDKNVILKQIAVSEFDVSFKFWADYLQEASLEAVMGIYSKMVRSYKLLV